MSAGPPSGAKAQRVPAATKKQFMKLAGVGHAQGRQEQLLRTRRQRAHPGRTGTGSEVDRSEATRQQPWPNRSQVIGLPWFELNASAVPVLHMKHTTRKADNIRKKTHKVSNKKTNIMRGKGCPYDEAA